MSVYHLNPKRAEALVRRGLGTRCETMGLSVYADAKDAVQWALRLPQIGSNIARLTLNPYSGKILNTPREGNSHNTWWRAHDFDPVNAAEIEIVI